MPGYVNWHTHEKKSKKSITVLKKFLNLRSKTKEEIAYAAENFL